MSRARPLPPDERRAAVVAAARPLVAQYGDRVTTAQIAEAAGIAEGTLFRVFATKADVVAAVLADALDTSPMIAWLEAQQHPTLHDEARAVLVELQRRFAEVSAMFTTLFAGPDGHDKAHKPTRDHARARADHLRLRDAIADALARHPDELRAPAARAASLLLGLATIASHGLAADANLTDPDDLVDLFLHGTAKEAS